MEMLSYAFMQRAFIVGILLAIAIPMIGTVIVLRRLSMMGDALSHVSLSGVTLGLLMGVNPILVSMIFCVVGALGIEYFRKKIPAYSELAIALMMSIGIGLAGLLSGFVDSAASFTSFLFGSIVAISDFEFYLVICVAGIVFFASCLLYKELFYVAIDEEMAKLAGVPVSWINFLLTVLTAITISIAARTVGVLIVSSLLVLPVVCAMQLAKSYKQTIVFAMGFAVFFVTLGLTGSYYLGIKPGGAIVLLATMVLLFIFIMKSFVSRSS